MRVLAGAHARALRPVQTGQVAREPLLERIRRALAAGDEDEALRIARVLEQRFAATSGQEAEGGSAKCRPRPVRAMGSSAG